MTKIIILISFFISIFSLSHTAIANTDRNQCVNIYYDQVPNDEKYLFGHIYATYLQNLLGHFPHLELFIIPIEQYKSGHIETCKSSFYIGSYFENKIPKAFLKDFATTKKNVAWLGYSSWLLDESTHKKIFSSKYSHLTKLDSKNLLENGKPTFFQKISYKKEYFYKFGEWVTRNGKQVFAAPFEMVALKPLPSANVLSWAEHTHTKEKLPYIIRNKNHFFVADIPFSYIHESDRYLIFSDLLFDILNESPRHKKHPALIRIEDVHPLTSIGELEKVSEVFHSENVPLHISIVPVFYDPLYRYDRPPELEWITMINHIPFKLWIEREKKRNTVFIWHGVTHQYKDIPNPHTGYSSDDFEFWDANNNKPIDEDSVSYVLNRLNLGWSLLKQLGLDTKAWLTPHYQASALNYRMFSKVFEWNVGRVIYFVDEYVGLPDWTKSKLQELTFTKNSSNPYQVQKEYFADLKVKTRGDWFGQLYPFEIYRDKYGQKLVPEILGNPQPFRSDHVVWPRSVDQILEDARRNLIIRDCWASLFFHPYLLNSYLNDGIGKFPGDASELRRLIKGLKKLGYEFINLNEFIEKQENVEIKNVKVVQ